MPQITCSNVSLAYDGTVVADHIDFTVNAGDYLCIVGENGSGKSTLIRGLLGLKSPAAGSIVFGDGLTQHQIGYLPQQTEVQRYMEKYGCHIMFYSGDSETTYRDHLITEELAGNEYNAWYTALTEAVTATEGSFKYVSTDLTLSAA